jgi:acyl-CoA thioesterase-1
MEIMTFEDKTDRRAVLGALVAAATGAPALAQTRRRGPAPPRPRTVALLGDSITAGFGLPMAAALPTQLQAEMVRLGSTARVRPLGVSGDTTALGLARLNLLTDAEADLWVVALGGNDLLQGLDPTITRANLEAIVAHLKTRGEPIVLAGIKAPKFLGRAYATAFYSAFTETARNNRLPFFPNLLEGVMGVRRLNQGDGIHPNAEGVKVIARALAPEIVKALSFIR